MRHFVRAFVVLLALPLAAQAQTAESTAAAMARPPLEDQFGFDSSRWRPQEGRLHPRRDGARREDARQSDFAGRDAAIFNCADPSWPVESVLPARRQHDGPIPQSYGPPTLEAAAARLKPYGTLTLLGSGPGCTLIAPLRLTKPIRILGQKDAVLMGPANGPCLIIEPGVSVAIADVKLRSWSEGSEGCITAEGADVSLERMAIESHGTALAMKGGRLSLRAAHLSGSGAGAVLQLDHAEFAIIQSGVVTFGDGAEIAPPDIGIAQISDTEFTDRGRQGVGLTLHGEGRSGARIVLDGLRLEGFVTGLVARRGARGVATHLRITHADQVGVEIIGAALDLSASHIDAGLIGIRLSGFTPDLRDEAPRLENNEIATPGIAGIQVAPGTPGVARDNLIHAAPHRCIAGFSRDGDYRDRANICSPFQEARAY